MLRGPGSGILVSISPHCGLATDPSVLIRVQPGRRTEDALVGLEKLLGRRVGVGVFARFQERIGGMSSGPLFSFAERRGSLVFGRRGRAAVGWRASDSA